MNKLKEKRICKIEGCENKPLAKGFCNKHYQRLWKHDDPFFVENERHGLSYTSEYTIWHSMKKRCYNKNSPSYKYYGKRGIKVCDCWKNSFLTFYKDMGSKPFPKAQIDRIDNDGNYELGNCRWTTAAGNCHNSSVTKLTMQKVKKIRELYKIGNITQKELGLIYGVDFTTIGYVVNHKTWR